MVGLWLMMGLYLGIYGGFMVDDDADLGLFGELRFRTFFLEDVCMIDLPKSSTKQC